MMSEKIKKIISTVLFIALFCSTIHNTSFFALASQNTTKVQEVSQNELNPQSESETENNLMEESNIQTPFTVYMFEELPAEIREQTVEVGAEESAIIFPTTLTVSVNAVGELLEEVVEKESNESVDGETVSGNTTKEKESVSENNIEAEENTENSVSENDAATEESKENSVSENDAEQTKPNEKENVSGNSTPSKENGESTVTKETTDEQENVSENATPEENGEQTAEKEEETTEPEQSATEEEKQIEPEQPATEEEKPTEAEQPTVEEEKTTESEEPEEIISEEPSPTESENDDLQEEPEVVTETVENEVLYSEQNENEVKVLEKIQEITLENIIWVIDAENSDSGTFISDESAFGYCYTYVPVIPQMESEEGSYALADGVSLPTIKVYIGQKVMKTRISLDVTEVIIPAKLSAMFNPEQISIPFNGKNVTDQVISACYGVLNKGKQDKVVGINITLTDENATAEGDKVIFASSREEVSQAKPGDYVIYLEAVPGVIISEITKDTNGMALSNVEIEPDYSKAVAIPGEGRLEVCLEKSTYKLYADETVSGNGINSTLELESIGENSSYGFTLSGCMNTNSDWTRLIRGIGIHITYDIMDVVENEEQEIE